MRCDDFHAALVELAGGGNAPEAARHVEGCEACRTRLGQLTRLIEATRTRVECAPRALVAQARALAGARPRLVARLLGNGLASSGARRGGSHDFALHVGVEDFSLHLHYTPTGSSWEVLGRAPTAGWAVVHAGGEVPCGVSGRFRLIATGLDDTAFTLRKDGLEVEVPSARELTDRAT